MPAQRSASRAAPAPCRRGRGGGWPAGRDRAVGLMGRRRPQALRPVQHDQHHRQAVQQHAQHFGVDDLMAERWHSCDRPDRVRAGPRGIAASSTAPRITPGMWPMPPSTTIASTITIDSISDERLPGETKPWNAANIAPDDAAERRAHRERQQLDVARVDAHRLGGDLVLADRHPGAADARVLQARMQMTMMMQRQQQEQVVVERTPTENFVARTASSALREVDADDAAPGRCRLIPCGPLVKLSGALRLFRKIRTISPKPSVTIAR